ncbi:PAS domain S-box protein [Cecembia rubra]|uniref:PAS domain S-box protein n=1 Tax=Cecembia rubra TaxID=1485585 RepID=UPI0027150331|nr:PAS domain S-box protein [Cecembia rubra]
MAYFEKLDISIFSFFDEVTDPMMVFSEDQIVFVNKFWRENFQYDFQKWQEFVNNGVSQNELYRFFLAGEQPKTEFLRTLKDNRGFHPRFQWTFISLASNNEQRYCLAKGKLHITFGDLLQYESQGIEIAEQQDLGFIKTMLRNSHDMMAIVDGKGVFKFVSSSIIDKLGFKPEVIIGRSIHDFVELGAIELVDGSFEELNRKGREIRLDFWVHKPDGTRVFLESFGKNLLDEPTVEGILFSVRDVTEFYEAKKSLQKRYDLENLINKVSTKFVNADFHQLDQVFQDSLRMLGEFERADRAYIFLIHEELKSIEYAYEWTGVNVEPQIQDMKYIPLYEDAATMKTLRKGEIFIVSDVESLPDSFSFEKEVYKMQGIKSVLLIPIFSEHKLIGFFGLDAVKEKRDWVEKDEYVLRQLGDIYAGSFINRAIKKSLDRNEKLLESTEILAKSGSWRYSSTKNRLHISKGFNKIFEIPEGITSVNLSELFPKILKVSRKNFIRDVKKAVLELKSSSGELSIKSLEGKEKILSYSIVVNQGDGNKATEIYGYCTDITHKRDAEKFLKLQSQILAQVDDPIFVTDINWNVIYLNKAAKAECSLFHNSDFQGTLFDLFDFLSEDVNEIKRAIMDLKNDKVFRRDLNLKSINGSVQPYDLSVQAFLNDEQEKLGYSFVIRNLSILQKQEALAKRAKIVVENSPAVLFTVDPNENFRILYISDNIKQFGYVAEDLISKGTSILDIIHPDDVEELLDFHLQEQHERGIPAYSGEYRIKKSTGEYRWVEDKSRELLDQDGRVVLHEGILQDITEQKKNREEIIRSQERYRVLASNIPFISVFLIDKDLKYIVAQGSTMRNWGMKPSDFEGKTLSQVHKNNLSQIEPAVKTALLEKRDVNKILIFRKRVYEMTIKPIMHEGEVEYALGILRDINEEYNAKENLQKSEEKYRRLVEESTEIIFSMEPDFTLTYVSPNIKQFMGYEPNEVINLKLTEFLHEDNIYELKELIGDPVKFLKENQYLEFKLRSKDGEYRIFSSNGKLIATEDGRVFYNGIARDITQLKEAQREMLLAKEKAEQASKVKSQFLSIMSHEIRTPMNAVIGMAHLLIEDNPRPDQLENLKTLQFSAENLLGLINDILDFTKIDSGKVELEKLEFELKNVINRIIHSYTYQAREKALDIQFEYDGEIPPKLIGDPVRLGQVVNNLISNAVKFTQQGFIRIVLKRVDEDSEDIKVQFDFEDTGIGIPEEKMATVFEAFTQASAETTRKYGGTGLGLAIVKRLVNLFGGDILIKQRPGGGTVFSFTIKFQKVKASSEHHFRRVASYNRNLASAKILVAEDNLVNQIMINKFLTKWGVGEIVIAENGQMAIQEFDLHDFNLILLDLQMPEMDGFEVASYIRRHPDIQKRSVPIIALTASSLIDVKMQLEEVGMDDFIPKPFNPDNLYSKIIRFLKI